MNTEYQSLFEHHPDGVLLIDGRSETVTNANKSVCRMLGLAAEEIISKRLDAVFRVTGESGSNLFSPMASESIPCTLSKDSKTFNASLIRIEEEPLLFACFLSPRAFEEVDYAELVENSRDMIIRFDAEGRLLFFNAAVEEMLGYSELELRSKTIADIIAEDMLSAFTEKFRATFSGEADHFEPCELSLRDSKGETVWIELACRIVKSGDRVEHVEGIARNISGRKKTEELLEKSQANIQALLNNTALSFFLIGKNYCIQAFNKTASQVIKILYRKDLTEGSYVSDYLRGKDLANFTESFSTALTGEIVVTEREFGPVNNSAFYLEFRFVPVYLRKDEIIGVSISILDITNRKMTERSLEQSREQYRMITELISDFAFAARLDSQGRFVLEWVTEAFCRISGYTMSELLYEIEFDSIIYKHDLMITREQRRLLMAGQPSVSEYRIETRTGEVRWIRRSAQPVWDEAGLKVLRFVGAGQDITEQKQSEEALRKNVENYHTLINSLAEGVFLADSQGHIVNCNPSAAAILGYSEDDLLGRSLVDGRWHIVHEDYSFMPTVEFPAYITLVTGEPVIGSILGLYRPDESLVWISINTQPIYQLGHKGIYGVVVSFNDVTAMKEAEGTRRILEKELYRLSLVARQTTSAVMITDTNHQIVWVNEAFTKMSGYRPHEITGKYQGEILFGPDSTDQNDLEVVQKLNRRESVRTLFRFYSKSREIFWVQMLIDPMYDAEGRHIGFISVQNDITAKVRSEKELKAAQVIADTASIEKTLIFEHVHNELKMPMDRIIVSAGQLVDDLDDSSARAKAETIFSGGRDLLKKLNEILNLAKTESDSYKLRFETLDITPMISETVELFSESAEAKGLSMLFEKKPISAYVSVDERLFRAVINNLLSNAVKYTEAGSIAVIIDGIDGEASGKVQISVRDTGSGISEERMREVFGNGSGSFDAFENQNRFELAVTKRYVELLRGELLFQSETGKGSLFRVLLPLSTKISCTS